MATQWLELDDGRRIGVELADPSTPLTQEEAQDYIEMVLAGEGAGDGTARSALTPRGQEIYDEVEPTYGAINHFGMGMVPFLKETSVAMADPGATFWAAWNGRQDPRASEYYDGLAAARALEDDYDARNPAAGLGLKIAGGVTGGLGLAKNVGLFSAANPLPKAAALGAAEGGVYGFSEGEGGLMNRLDSARTGAMWGAGGALAVPALSRTYTGAKNILTGNTMNKAQRMLMRDLASDGYEFGKGVPKTSAPWRRVPEAGYGKPVTLADVAGEQTRARMAAAANMPGNRAGQVIDNLKARRLDQAGRITDDLTSATGINRANLFDVADEVNDRARKSAQSFYDQAYEAHRYLDDPVIDSLIDQPAMKAVHEDAVNLYNIEKGVKDAASALGGGYGSNMPGLRAIYDVDPKTGEKVLSGVRPDLQVMDYMKRALDDRISVAYRAGQGGKAEGLKQIREILVERLDDIAPEYRAARQVWRGKFEVEEAIKKGKRFNSASAAEVENAFGKMTPSERVTYKQAALSDLLDKMSKKPDTADAAGMLASSPDMRRKMRLLFTSDDAFEEWMKRAKVEVNMARTENAVMSGSRTAPMQAQMEAISGSPVIDTVDFLATATGEPIAAARAGGRLGAKALERLRRGSDQTASQLLEMGMVELTPEQIRMLDDLAYRKFANQQTQQNFGRLSGATSGAASRYSLSE
jgi:hypothetical protein